MFNALKYTQELERAGFSREQADASIRILIEVMNENFATKTDLHEAVLKLESKINELEYRVVMKLGTLTCVAIGVAVSLAKLIH